MPPGPIEGSCLPSPTATSFAPERAIRSVRASRRLWSAIPASSKKTVLAAPISRRPVFARATSASSVSVCPWSAGLSAPRRSAVEPDTATPITSRPAICSALAAASITTPLPVPAGPIRTARRSGPVNVASACSCSTDRGAAMRSRDLLARVCSRLLADVASGGLGRDRRRGARSPAPARGSRASSSSRPPGSGLAARRPSRGPRRRHPPG